MDISDYIFQIFPKEIATEIIIYGFMYFLLLFYGTKQWNKKYSDFDKVIFSAMAGGVVWYFFISPIAFFLTTLSVFENELSEIKYSYLLQYDYFFYIIFAYLLIWKLILSNKPLTENKHLFFITKYLIQSIIIFITLTNFILIFIFSFANYPEYVSNQISSLIFLVTISPFYLIFSEIFEEKFVTASQINELFNILKFKARSLDLFLSTKCNFLKRRKTIIILIFILLIVLVSIFVGSNYVRPTYTVSERTTKLEISTLRILEAYYKDPEYIKENSGNISGNLTVEQDYSIKFGLISWIKIKPNISLIDESGKPYRTDSNINFSGEYIIINGSKNNIKNITLYGKRSENKLLKIYNVKTKDVNETIQRMDIEFINKHNYEVYINKILISKDDKLKLIKYEENNIRLNNLKLDENIKNQFAHSLLEIYDVRFDNNNFSNHSIILFFEKTK